MLFENENVSTSTLKNLYLSMLKPRLIEEKMLILLRQNKISKWFSGIGQEATSVGVALATNSDEYILPMHRNLGVFTSRDISLIKLFNQFQGKLDGFTKGRDRSFHFGVKELNIVGMISHLGPQMGIADGIALAKKMKGEKKATIVFTGDLIPTVGHLPLAYVMGYDIRPLISLEEKSSLLKLAYEKQFLLFLEHDPFHELIDLCQTDKGIRMNENHTLKSFFE